MEWNYCPYCAAELTTNDGHSMKCTGCGKLHYFNPKSTVGIIFFNTKGQLILSVRGREPAKGKLDIIGGFVDLGENIEEALYREVKEEAGLSPDDFDTPTYLGSLYANYDFMGYNVPHTVSVYMGEVKEPLVAGDDVESFVIGFPEEIDMSQLVLPEFETFIQQAIQARN